MDRYSEIRYAVDGAIATITLHRPARRNGYTARMADERRAAFDAADRDAAVRAVVLTGSGPDFTVGADLSGTDLSGTGLTGSLADDSPDSPRDGSQGDGPPGNGSGAEPADYREPAGRCALRIFEMSKPVIAAMRGVAVGAGSTIVLPADYRLARTHPPVRVLFPPPPIL